MGTRYWGALAATTAILLTPATVAFAQDEPAAAAATEEEIIVTARKRDERLQDIPLAVTAISADEIQDAGLGNMDDLRTLTPNLNIITGQDRQPNVTIRGIGTFDVSQGVGFYVNDVALFEGEAVPFVDVERIEVLRGPQGTLYGGNNIGGAIKYVTAAPSSTLTGALWTEVGEQNTRNVTGFISGPLLGDALLARLALVHNDHDGFIRNTFTGERVGNDNFNAARLTLEASPGDTRFRLYLYAGRDDTDMVNLYRVCPAGPPFNCPSPNDRTYVDTVEYDHRSNYDQDVFSGSLQVDHEFTGVTLTSVSAAFQSDLAAGGDFDLAALAPFVDNWGTRDRAWEGYSQELRLASTGAGPFSWLVGAFYSHREVDDDVLFRSFNMGTMSYDVFPNLFSSTFEQMALFANGSLTLGPWVLEAGARLERDEQDARERGSGSALGHSDEVVLPRVSVTYHFSEELMAYGSVARGFQPGGVFSGNAGLTDYESETTTNYELGLKADAFDGRLGLEAAVFFIEYEDRVFVEKTITPPTVDTRENIGSSENVGFELSARWSVTPDLTISGSVGVTDAEWGDDARYNSPTVGSVISVAGLTAPYTPEYQSNLAVDWERPIGNGLTFGARADVVWVGEHFWDVENLRRQEPYQLVNFGVRLESEHWELSAHVENAFDEQYNARFFYGPGLGAPYDLGMLGQPRLVTARFGVRF